MAKIGGLGEISLLDRASLRLLWFYSRPYKASLFLAFFTALPLAAMGGLLAWLLNRLVKNFSLSMDFNTICFWAGAAFLVVFVKGILSVLNRYIMTRMHIHIAHDMRLALFEKTLQSPISFHNASKTGHISNSLINDVKFASAGVIELFSAIWQYPVSLLVLVGTMFYFNFLIASTVCILFPFLSVVISKIGRLSRNAEFRYMENQARLQGFVVESLINIRQVKYLTMLGNQKKQLDEKGKSMIESRLRATLLSSVVSPISDILSAISLCVMAFLAYIQLQNGSTSPEEIAGCLAAGLGLMKPIKGLSSSIVMLQQSFAAIKRFSRIHAFREKRSHKVIDLPAQIEEIEFKDVGFTYDGRHDMYRNLNIKFRIGERVAIAGKSGSGKSTLLNLISGFYPCTSGQILIQGTDLVLTDIDSWFSKIGVVSQDSLLFDDTILNNILYGNEQATQEKLEQAIKRSGCREMINRFPEGLETRVGERGCFLSGGEKKRVALARAMVRQISVLILDEATSELDVETERSILSDIKNMGDDLLVIFISHHPEIFQYCNRVLILGNGRIQEMKPREAYDAYRCAEGGKKN